MEALKRDSKGRFIKRVQPIEFKIEEPKNPFDEIDKSFQEFERKMKISQNRWKWFWAIYIGIVGGYWLGQLAVVIFK